MVDNCQPSDNILYTPNARLVFNRLPGISFDTQSLIIPGFSINEATQFTSLLDVPVPGEKISFEPLVISFLVNEDLSNWQAVFDWMLEIADPKDMTDRIGGKKSDGQWRHTELVSDASIVFTSNTGSAVKTIKIIDAWPSAMAALPMNLNEQPEPVITDLTVTYSYFEIQRDDC